MNAVASYSGGCLCGAIRYRATSAPIRGVICHCSMCRKHSGAPALAFVHFRIEDFKWIHGEPLRYRSSKTAERGFCAICGSTLTMHEAVLSDRVQIVAGSLNRPELVSMDDHVWVQHLLPWFRLDDGLPHYMTVSASVPTEAGEDDLDT